MMTRKYSPNHPAVMSSPGVMTPQAWSRLYRVPLSMIGAGFVVALAGWLMPPIALYGSPVSIIWCIPGGVLCLAGFARCQDIYDLEKSYDR